MNMELKEINENRIESLQNVDIDKYFKGTGVHGAIYGALIGNSLSDFIGAIVDFPVEVAINITLGCLAIIPLVWLYLFVKKDQLYNL